MDLKTLIGKAKFELLKRKHENLSRLWYICVCETCNEIFFKRKLGEVQQLMLDGIWRADVPMLWFIEAGRHWLKFKFHSIRVYVADKEDLKFADKTLVKDLSAEWSELSKAKRYSDDQLAAELDALKEKALSLGVTI